MQGRKGTTTRLKEAIGKRVTVVLLIRVGGKIDSSADTCRRVVSDNFQKLPLLLLFSSP